MKNFTKEQIAKINSISKLPAEQQNQELQKFLSTLVPDQIEFLKTQQKQECVFCLIKENKIKAKKIYEDKDFMAILDINPANPGHVIVFPKEHINSSFQLNPKIFELVNKLSLKISDVVKAQGLNIFIANGPVAGQKIDHIIIHIIPRFNNDNIEFAWEPKKISDEQMSQIETELREKTKDIIQEEKPVIKEEIKDKKIYKTKSRLP